MAGRSRATGRPAWAAFGCIFSACLSPPPPPPPAPPAQRKKGSGRSGGAGGSRAGLGGSVGDFRLVGMKLLQGPEAAAEAEQLKRCEGGEGEGV